MPRWSHFRPQTPSLMVAGDAMPELRRLHAQIEIEKQSHATTKQELSVLKTGASQSAMLDLELADSLRTVDALNRSVVWHILHILLILHCMCHFIAVSPASGRLAMLLRLPLPLPARTTAPRLFAAFLLLLWVAPPRPLPAHFFFYSVLQKLCG